MCLLTLKSQLHPVDLYHKYCPSLPKVVKLSDTRKKYIRARWKEYPELQFWEQFFKRVEASDFLTGRADYGNRKPFIADFEWLVRPSNFLKVLEGKYDNRSPTKRRDDLEEILKKGASLLAMTFRITSGS